MMGRSGIRAGFTIVELAIVIAILAIVVFMLLPFLVHDRGHSIIYSRTKCASHLSTQFKALYVYAARNEFQFPTSFVSGEAVELRGFNDRPQRDTVDDLPLAARDASLTTPLFQLVRESSLSTSNFVCPSLEYGEEDPISTFDAATQSYNPHMPVDLMQAFDFGFPRSMTYSYYNFHGLQSQMHWNTNARPDWIFAGDDNSADDSTGAFRAYRGPGALHSTTAAAGGASSAALLAALENSQSHDGEGQNFLFADGHVEWSTDPFVGPNDDNAYALNVQPDASKPPIAAPVEGMRNIGVRDGRQYWDTDVALIPITGNNGPDLGAGHPGPGKPFNLQSTWQQYIGY